MFLLNITLPDYDFLKVKHGISNQAELKKAISAALIKVDLSHKSKDFEHLLFEKRNSLKILSFGQFVENL